MNTTWKWVAWATGGSLVLGGCHCSKSEMEPCYEWHVAFLDGTLPVEATCALLAAGEWQGGFTGVSPDSLLEVVAVVDGVAMWPEAPQVDAMTVFAEHPSGMAVALGRTRVHGCGTQDIYLPTPTALSFQRAEADRSDTRWYGKLSPTPAPPDLASWMNGNDPDVIIDQAASSIGIASTCTIVFPVNQAEYTVHMQWFRWTPEGGLQPDHVQSLTVPVADAGQTHFATF